MDSKNGKRRIADKKILQGYVLVEMKLSDETGDFAGGLIVKNGPVAVNNTLELLIDLCRSEMAADVAKVLFS